MPVSMFFKVTVAPEITAPLESFTVPKTVAASNCAFAPAPQTRREKATAMVCFHARLCFQLGNRDHMEACRHPSFPKRARVWFHNLDCRRTRSSFHALACLQS